jgi:hypothetical protein
MRLSPAIAILGLLAAGGYARAGALCDLYLQRGDVAAAQACMDDDSTRTIQKRIEPLPPVPDYDPLRDEETQQKWRQIQFDIENQHRDRAMRELNSDH